MQNRGVDRASGVSQWRVRLAPRARPEWLRLRSLALVFVGGSLGAGAREALAVALPGHQSFPVAILCANLIGALALGVLLEALASDGGLRAARARSLLGTGLLGGFTTYSALALGVVRMAVAGRVWEAVAYGAGTVVLGACATWAGIAIGAALRQSRLSRRSRPSREGRDV